jgi:hypothetical protein
MGNIVVDCKCHCLRSCFVLYIQGGDLNLETEDLIEKILSGVDTWVCHVCDKKIPRKKDESGVDYNNRVFCHVEKHLKGRKR